MPSTFRRPIANRVFVLALGAIVATSLSACSASNTTAANNGASSKTLTVGFVPDPSWAQVPVAEANGYFKSEGLNVKVIDFSTGVQALQALAAGQVDVTTSADVPVSAVLASSKNMDIIADGSRWKGSVIVGSAKAGIKTASDLAGKKVGTPLGTSAAYFGSSFLKESGANAQLINVAPSAIVTAMQQGNVPAVSIFQPFQQQVIAALGSDAVVLKPAAGTYVQQSLYLASTSAVKNKASALKSFELALNKASKDLTSQKASAVSAVAKATQLSPDLVKTILPEFDYTIELPSDLPTGLTSLGMWAKTAGNLPSSATIPNYSTFVNRDFLPAS
ncbi:ABC transporter substrate-binding protein [Lacisediminihabitans sp.]|jgi:NitT/TauT family transport system substrate-binding protein|uniref:ABC transporter substrate-binding protein n=1 Tax=Lacisediminihabitans sp. TaxID=2787631 RepID=UPI002F950291